MHKCILLFKCLNGLVPDYFNQYFTLNKSIHRLNTRQSNDIHLPKPNFEVFKKSFIYSAAYNYNSLPNSIKQSTSLNNFKTEIYKHFLTLV